MAAYTLPASFAVGEVLTAATMNKLRTSLAFLAGAKGAQANATKTTTSSTFVSLTGGPAVTLTTGTTALVIIGAELKISVSTTAYAGMSFKISGATTRAASTTTSFSSNNAFFTAGSRIVYVTGLTAGSNTFTAQYSRFSSGTASFKNRSIAGIPLP